MMLNILTGYWVIKLLSSCHTHISYHNNGANFSRVFRQGRGNVNAHKLYKRKPNTGKGTTNLNNTVDLPVLWSPIRGCPYKAPQIAKSP